MNVTKSVKLESCSGKGQTSKGLLDRARNQFIYGPILVIRD